MLCGTYFLLVMSMPGKYRKGVLNFNYSQADRLDLLAIFYY